MLPVNEMILFVDVVELENFSSTAKKHKITPAAVSKKMSHLETLMGAKLLNRSTRSLVLTDAGRMLYERCKYVSRDLYHAYHGVQDVHNEPKGELTLCAPTNFSHLILAPLLKAFCEQYPQVGLNVKLYDMKAIPAIGEFDIAIMAGELKESALFYKHLYTVNFCICAAPSYFERYEKPLTPHDLTQHNCIDYDYREQGPYWRFTIDNEVVNIPVSGTLKSNNALFIKNIALQGLGLVCLPEFMVIQEIEAGLLEPVLTDLMPQTMPSLPVHALYHFAPKEHPLKLRVFLSFLYDKLCVRSVSDVRRAMPALRG